MAVQTRTPVFYFDWWVEREGLDLIKDYKVDDVFSVPLKYWARTGGHAVQIQLTGTGGLNAAYVQEIPSGGHLEPQKHLYEEMVYILSGRGSTTVWYEGQQKNSFEWKPGSLFSVPLNARYQHFNGSGVDPARYLAVTTAPVMMNLIRDEDFVFNNSAVFPLRYQSEDDYFDGQISYEEFTGWGFPYNVASSNFFADVEGLPEEVLNRGHRGAGTVGISFLLAGGVLGAHILDVPGGVFTKLHRHGPGAHVLWLRGEGYSLMWPDGGEEVRVDWKRGSMVVPPSWWWHMHAVVSTEPARHLALRLGNTRAKLDNLNDGLLQSSKEGGSQMDFDDYPAELKERLLRRFLDECARRGTTPHLEAVTGI